MSGKILVIVESPTKMKTISKYLGKDYVLSSSRGHIIDLPKSRMAIDLEHDFEPEYITIRGKAKVLNELKKEAKKASMILLATDPDREGEAISWHLSNSLSKICGNIKRIEFNEITKNAVIEAVKSPRELNMNLVNAQQARRVLDRIVGYSISPILWKKVKKGLSAGRVQSVALKMICEREEEIERFVSDEYWTIDLRYSADGRDYTASLQYFEEEKIHIGSKEEADDIVEALDNAEFIIQSVKSKPRTRKPQPPYITSKLQQDAANRLGFTTSKTMLVAQQLYEGIALGKEGQVGLITYMRTDSTRVSESALSAVRDYITRNFSGEYLPESANHFTNKRGAQDAHEAIRPSDVFRTPDSIKDMLSSDQYKLYNLIWKKFVASQMTPERSIINTLSIVAEGYDFRSSATETVFEGFAAIDRDAKLKREKFPELKEGDIVRAKEFMPEQHFTSPPPRYNDASLVKFLEESGIGRPSTYAPTINTLINRYYVTRSGRQLVPTQLGRMVNNIVKDNFKDLVSVDFTATMEANLDRIEDAQIRWKDMIGEFYGPFHEVIVTAEQSIGDMKGSLDEPTDIVCEKCGKPMVKKLGKYGYFLACSGFPECRNAKSLSLGKCPKENCGGDVVKRSSKKGRPFYACTNYPDCDFITRDQPTGRECPKCGSVLFTKRIRGKGERVMCLRESCGYFMDILDEDQQSTVKEDYSV